ncbi:toll/interleukin-1 receptor domain-containing protein [Streptomyces sp. NPDC002574]|uniref:toll/interleukin-1 receptor domain-containing protein n=1 Tax=Streptomyces sp. NPDC002574 TaxID=3364652 RepID=UPI0036A4B9B3
MFISHSSTHDDHAAQVRDLVAEGLRKRGYEVLVDVSAILPGQKWRPRIYELLRDCHAAVVLVNRKALESRWVQREVDILLWRQASGNGFHILPALVGDVAPGEISEERFGELNEMQALGSVASAEQAAQSIVHLFPVIGETPAGGAMHQWLRNISSQLSQVREGPGLDMVAEALELPQEDRDLLTVGGTAATDFLAVQMLHTHPAVRIRNLVHAVRYQMDPGSLANLVTLVLPVWVDAASARRVLPGRECTRHTVLLNVRKAGTGTHYLDRAFCMDVRRYHYLIVGIGGRFDDDDPERLLREACGRNVKRWLGMEPADPWETAVEEKDRCLYVILDSKGCDSLEQAERVVAWLHERLPWLHILLIPPGPVGAGERRSGGLADAVLVNPPFGADDEQVALRVAEELTSHVRMMR